MNILDKKEKIQLALILAGMIVMALLEIASIASVMPFLSVAADPDTIKNREYLAYLYKVGGFESTESYLIALATLTIVVLVVSNLFILMMTWFQYRFVWNRNHTISRRLLMSYLDKPYEYFLEKNSSGMAKNILEEAKQVSAAMLLPSLKGCAKAIVACAIMLFLIIKDPVIALITGSVLGVSYLLIYRLVKKKLENSGAKRVEANEKRYTAVKEVFGGIKEIKITGAESLFLKTYSKPSENYAWYHTVKSYIAEVPRYLLEMIAFSGIIGLAIYLIQAGDNFEKIVPTLGLYVFAGYKLMPALQQAFRGLTRAAYNKKALYEIEADMNPPQQDNGKYKSQLYDQEKRDEGNLSTDGLPPLISLSDVSYSYPSSDEYVLENINLTIPPSSTVGVIGKTGAGKTTLIDLITGLIRPDSGCIFVNNQELSTHNMASWQNVIGYVPQNIYLLDASIAKNVAFSTDLDSINVTKVERALDSACLGSFIQSLPNGLRSNVGEEGMKLSGGQRQRIGIARCLYRNPSVLVLDEATAELDEDTEKEILRNLMSGTKSRTVVLSTHRAASMEIVSNLFRVENKSVDMVSGNNCMA